MILQHRRINPRAMTLERIGMIKNAMYPLVTLALSFVAVAQNAPAPRIVDLKSAKGNLFCRGQAWPRRDPLPSEQPHAHFLGRCGRPAGGDWNQHAHSRHPR